MRVMVGYDGSPGAGAAIEVAARLLPGAEASIVTLWSAPFASETMRRRLWTGTAGVDAFVAAIEREAAADAERTAAMGAVLARAAGWTAVPLAEQGYAGEGLLLATLAEKAGPDVVVVGSRGLGGARAVLGSVSDMVVHYAVQPVLVVPYPLFVREREDLARGPVLIGWDGSAGARRAADLAHGILSGRRFVYAGVGSGPAGDRPPGAEFVRVEAHDGHLTPGRAVAAALARQAAAQHASVVAVGSRGRSPVREILLGSTAMATLHHTQRPVLVAHAAAARP